MEEELSATLPDWQNGATEVSGASCVSCVLSCVSLRPHGPQPSRCLCPWNYPGKNTGVGCHFLLQRIFPIQDWSLVSCSSSNCRQILYSLSQHPEQTVLDQVLAAAFCSTHFPRAHILSLCTFNKQTDSKSKVLVLSNMNLSLACFYTIQWQN